MTNSEDRVDSWRKEEIQVTTFKDGDDAHPNSKALTQYAQYTQRNSITLSGRAQGPSG